MTLFLTLFESLGVCQHEGHPHASSTRQGRIELLFGMFD
jgi:hypothetical protein